MTATSAHLVLENFVYRTKLITPTISNERYKEIGVDLPELEPGDQPGTARMFEIDWDEAGLDDREAWSGYDRFTWHQLMQVFHYPAASLGNRRKRYELILSDRHDLISALEAQASRVGYDLDDGVDNSSTAVGLATRRCVKSQLIREGDVWQLVLSWACFIKEVV